MCFADLLLPCFGHLGIRLDHPHRFRYDLVLTLFPSVSNCQCSALQLPSAQTRRRRSISCRDAWILLTEQRTLESEYPLGLVVSQKAGLSILATSSFTMSVLWRMSSGEVSEQDGESTVSVDNRWSGRNCR